MNLQEAQAFLASIPFIPAKWQGNTFFTPTLLVAHDMEAAESSTTAENCAGYFSRGPSTPASINYNVDNDSIVGSVTPGREAFHAAYGPINRCSVGTEHAGFANQTYEQWMDDYSYDMLWGMSAKLQAALCIVYSIPVEFRSWQDLRAGNWRGITTHWEVSKAYVPGGHSDPGPNFPMDEWIRAIRDTINNTPVVLLPEDEDMAKFWLIRADGSPAVHALADDYSLDHHLASEAQAKTFIYVTEAGGGKILTPPSDAKVETLAGKKVWVMSPSDFTFFTTLGG